jgi:glycosyltransferase involved in cell wall biosynthesis
MFPEAPIFASVWAPDPKVETVFGGRDVRTTFLQRAPAIDRHYRKLLPLMPAAFRSLDLSGFDLVISSSHSLSKTVRVPPGTAHVCYCHSPPRYLWDLYRTYNPGWAGFAGMPLARFLRKRDVQGANGVDRFIANSRTVADRIRRHYGREAEVVHPPVDVERFMEAAEGVEPEDWFLTGGRMVAYKRMEVLVEAANLGRFPLKVFGDGSARRSLERLAGPTVEFVGPVSDAEIGRLMARARAFLFAAEEDFGILPVEAQAAGRPVVAWDRGGVRETVSHGATGILVEEPTPKAFARGMEALLGQAWDRDRIQANACRFDTRRFQEGIRYVLGAASTGVGP